ncbi:MAG: peptidylprolyl isomerase [Clostridiales bacterium]|jgi:peptidyl-prolyl cis-trans isomerase B (cyclophilin B)|nr:peptidylprolyl isomerase [Clostridiales bacterium]
MDTKNIQATITMENGGKIELELYPDIAPITVENFVSLAKEGFYNGLIFHRVISGFMIQGGDPLGVGIGGSGKNIRGEFAINGFNNPLSHTRGVISMARSQDPNSASSQFFIMHADGPFLDGQYAAFGKVTDGISVVDEIASVQTDAQDKPLTDQRIAEISITDM